MTAPSFIVIDTNVVLDALVFRDPGVEQLFSQVRLGSLRWLVTDAMTQELQRVLTYEAIARRNIDADEVMQQAAALWQPLLQVHPDKPQRPGPIHCRDPDDQMFIDLAVSQQAAFLVSRDKALLSLAKAAQRHGVAVLTPQRWQRLHGSPT